MGDSFAGVVEVLCIGEAQRAVTGSEFAALTIAVLRYPARQRIGHTGIGRSVLLASR